MTHMQTSLRARFEPMGNASRISLFNYLLIVELFDAELHLL